MAHELNSLFFSKDIEQPFKNNNDFLNQNETLENNLSFYSSRNFYLEPLNYESNILNDTSINNLNNSIESNIFSNPELINNNIIELNNSSTIELYNNNNDEPNNLGSLKNNNINDLFTNSINFKEHKSEKNSDISEYSCDFKKDLNLKDNEEYSENEKVKNEETYENEKFYYPEIINDTENVKKEEDLDIKRKELNNQSYLNSLNEDKNKKDNLELNVSDNFPLSEKNEMIYNECILTNDFFETIENINTEISEKYNNLKDATENLIDMVNKCEYEKRINSLFDLSDKNSEMIDKFKKKSEDCIRKCRKFETSSENLIGECINTLAQMSICYAEWVCLHSFEINPIDEDLKDIKLFTETIQL